MGKGAAHWKKRQRDGSAGVAPDPTPRKKPAPRFVPIASHARDPLLGEPLSYATPHRLALRDYDAQRPKGKQSPIPFRIHAHDCAQRAAGAPVTLGEPPWTRAMDRYMDGWQRKADTDWIFWWRVPYVVDRLAAHAQSAQATFTLDVLNAVIACKKQDSRKLLPRWLRVDGRRVIHYVRTHLQPYDEPRHTDVGA